MATRKMLKRITKAYDWVDMEIRGMEQRRPRLRPDSRETLEDLDRKLAAAKDERYQLQVFYTDAIAGKSDEEILAGGISELKGYQDWRRGSSFRVVPLLKNCPRCEGTGLMPVMDSHGEYDGTEPCSCPQGKRVEARMQMPTSGPIVRLYEKPF